MTDRPDLPDHDPRPPAPGFRGVGVRALDAEERALAERIASAAPQRGPSAELDARILAMARAPVAAVSSTPSPDSDAASAQVADANAIATASASSVSRTTSSDVSRARRRRRWPAMAGIAATLTLTFGLAWQMRPQDAPLPESSEAPRAPSVKAPGAGGPRADDSDSAMSSAPPAAPGGMSDDRAPDAIVAEPEQAAASAAADDGAASPQRAKSPPAAASASGNVQGIAPAPPAPPAPISEAAPAASAPAPASATTGFDDPSPMDTPAPAPAMASPPPPPPAPIAAPTADQPNKASAPVVRHRDAEMKLGRQSNAAAEADAAASRSSDARTQLDRIDVTGGHLDGYGDQPLDDQPPASADTPAVREAWLARVRQLIANGRSDDARDSLREYRRRYPDAPIPDDLRPLLPAE